MKYPEELLDFCKTDSQIEIIESLIETQNLQETTRILGISRSKARHNLRMVESFAAKCGFSPKHGMNHPAAPSFITGRVTRQFNKDGDLVNIWYKDEQEKEDQLNRIKQTIEALQQDIIKAEPVPFDKTHFCTDRIPWINVGDGHLGMIASESITGEYFNQDIAKRELCVAVATLISELPDTERCVLQDMGDLSHFESQHRMSLNSGHSFDGCDYSDMIDITVEVMHFMIDCCLKKFKYVDVIINRGNHSDSNDVTMAINLRKFFENEPRLHVLDNRNRFIGYRMGNTFVLCTHGDKVKAEKIASVIHTDFKEDAGECKYIYADTAHIHTGKVMSETHGIVAESFNQIAAGDAYAHDGGWRSRKCLTAVIRSKTYGEQGRVMVSREQVQDIIAKANGTQSKAFARRKVYTV